MATIQSPGIGSGLDVNSIVESLVAAERGPATSRMDRKEADLQVKISTLGAMKAGLSEFRSSFSALKSTTTFNSRSVAVGGEGITASAGTAAAPGSYEIKVEQLATNHKMSTRAVDSEAAVVGSGELAITVGDKSYTVLIAEDAQSLADVRDAINDTLKDAGVKASLVNTGNLDGNTKTRLILSSEISGSDGKVQVTATDGPIADGGEGLENLFSGGKKNLVTAQDAVIRVDGYKVTSSSNTLTNVIQGVTIDLKEADADTAIDLTVSEDNSSFTGEIKKFVEGYNALMDVLQSADSYDSESQASGALFGDSVMRSFRMNMSSTMGHMDRSSNSPYNSLAALGVTTDATGRLSLDESKLNTALEKGYDDVVEFFTADETGFATRMDNFVYGYSRFDGIVQGRLDGLDNRISDINEQRVTLDQRVAKIEQRYRAQFQLLDQMMSQLNNTSSYLAAQLGNLSSGDG